VRERHRHRYEVNPRFVPTFVENGLVVSGTSPDGKFVEIVELPGHPWFLGCQFHPEFRSKPWDPHPLFVSYVEAALRAREARAGDETIASRPAAAIEAGG